VLVKTRLVRDRLARILGRTGQDQSLRPVERRACPDLATLAGVYLEAVSINVAARLKCRNLRPSEQPWQPRWPSWCPSAPWRHHLLSRCISKRSWSKNSQNLLLLYDASVHLAACCRWQDRNGRGFRARAQMKLTSGHRNSLSIMYLS
jgi:hypothetical protein